MSTVNGIRAPTGPRGTTADRAPDTTRPGCGRPLGQRRGNGASNAPRGTTITEERQTTDVPNDPTRELRGGYEWTCPFCGTSRLNRVGDEEGETHALAALRAHVRSSDDDEHGPANDYPSGYDPDELADHVTFTD